MDELSVSFKIKKPQYNYSEAFKRQVVQEFEQGFQNKDQLQLKYGIGGNATILRWCRKYGKFAYPKQNPIVFQMKDVQKARIKELEKQLKEAELKIKIYDKLIEVTNRELDTDVIKKIEAKLSENWQQKEK
jgi:transposase-like protein